MKREYTYEIETLLQQLNGAIATIDFVQYNDEIFDEELCDLMILPSQSLKTIRGQLIQWMNLVNQKSAK